MADSLERSFLELRGSLDDEEMRRAIEILGFLRLLRVLDISELWQRVSPGNLCAADPAPKPSPAVLAAFDSRVQELLSPSGLDEETRTWLRYNFSLLYFLPGDDFTKLSDLLRPLSPVLLPDIKEKGGQCLIRIDYAKPLSYFSLQPCHPITRSDLVEIDLEETELLMISNRVTTLTVPAFLSFVAEVEKSGKFLFDCRIWEEMHTIVLGNKNFFPKKFTEGRIYFGTMLKSTRGPLLPYLYMGAGGWEGFAELVEGLVVDDECLFPALKKELIRSVER
ncbi:hypothetical protein HYW53_00605 [Candidatus Giovannonibacteria bacterium]|nr:hypothetical protein [Candidatus Giovannonibacteria bacterium]